MPSFMLETTGPHTLGDDDFNSATYPPAYTTGHFVCNMFTPLPTQQQLIAEYFEFSDHAEKLIAAPANNK